MKHFVFTMQGQAVAPAGGGTTEGWFFYYKWDVDEETFVPVPDTLSADTLVADDLLWFVLDDRVIGYVPVLRTAEDAINDKIEIYYDTRKVHDATKQRQIHTKQPMGVVTDASGTAFFDTLRLNFDANYPSRDLIVPDKADLNQVVHNKPFRIAKEVQT